MELNSLNAEVEDGLPVSPILHSHRDMANQPLVPGSRGCGNILGYCHRSIYRLLDQARMTLCSKKFTMRIWHTRRAKQGLDKRNTG